MILPFYSYSLEEDDEDVISYSFITSNGSLYYVYFDPYQYSDRVDQFPYLLNLGFGFGFQRMSARRSGLSKDAMIGNTISRIISDFMKLQGNNVVLLYHCDYSDSKQKGRDKIFQDWYEHSTFKSTVVKKRIEVSQVDANGGQLLFYMGYLTASINPDKVAVENEFVHFTQNLVDGKP